MMTQNLLDLKKQELLNQIDSFYSLNNKIDQSCQTDDDIVYNYVWNKYYSYFENYFYEKFILKKEIPENNIGEEKLDSLTIQIMAQENMSSKGLTYDDKTGFYFDQENGLYYDQAKQLYFDSENCVYYHYCLNQYTKRYNLRYHSKIKSKNWNIINNFRKETDLDQNMNTCFVSERKNNISESENSSNCDDLSLKIELNETQTNKYPPCIRAIVVNSKSDRIRIGSLFIIPYTGGCIGNSAKLKDKDIKNNYVIDFKEEEKISDFDAKVDYDSSDGCYYLTQINCTNVMFLNNKNLNNVERTVIKHLDKLIIEDLFELDLHIHSGFNTCLKCEPGEIMHRLNLEKNSLNNAISSLNIKSKEELRKEKIKSIKKKYGLKWNNIDLNEHAHNFIDRAKQRRNDLGIDYPNTEQIIDFESTATNTKLSKNNKGRKLLEKMGWREGCGLGKYETGITEPINQKLKLSREGIGAEFSNKLEANLTMETDETSKKNLIKWKKKVERFNKVNTGLNLDYESP